MTKLVVVTLALMGCQFRVNPGLMIENTDMTSADIADPPPAVLDMHMHKDMTVIHDMVKPLDLTPPPDLTPTPHYMADIQAILDKRGCTTSICHQAYKPLVVPAPSTAPQWQQNYQNVLADVVLGPCDMVAPDQCAIQSLLLQKPLGTSDVMHAGKKQFASSSDPDFQLILIWIEEGAPF